MKSTLIVTALFLALSPAAAQASAAITSVALNGDAVAQVEPGADIHMSVTAALTSGTKWKGTRWGITHGSSTPGCVNSKNAKEGTRNNPTGVFAQSFLVKAPATPGVYNLNLLADEANGCGKPVSPLFQALRSVRVGADTSAPVLAPHPDIFATTTGTSIALTYAPPAATDDRDGVVAVSCSPASGSEFALGTSTVTCAAQDTAGNTATGSFLVVVTQEAPEPQEPAPYVMASQPDESYLCQFSWRLCFIGDPNYATQSRAINLGRGEDLGGGTLTSVTIARDESDPNTPLGLWKIRIKCFTDAAYSSACTDWVAPAASPSNLSHGQGELVEFAATPSDAGKHWTAFFTDASRNSNADGTAPVAFTPGYYYQLVIDDNDWDVGAWGSESLAEPYWVITGLR